ncbi:MAG: GAF domain-containing protein [Candidatus Omnitrophica bacterium]|nr:GAF domain-containing protein [Candidatus Omnitrophota bacterium]MDE2010076.1 GAF domain-containing protein [Candidatus Omnitrophota bacterium]MDE2215184.1 GAF domain-containing protein [Candidatus Omnitrophota bacterium]MDE2232083.1 GAF domain-containing protein [Candidatus Omnitrophota bacterium]
MAERTKNKKVSVTAAQELQILRNIVDIASSELDLSLTLQLIVKIVTEMTDADSVFIYLLDENKSNLVLMASKTAHKKELGNIVLKTGEGITGWVARENKTVAIKARAYKDPRFKSFDVLPEDRYEAFLSVPIIYKGRAVGVVNVQHKSQQDYSVETVNLIDMIAKQAGGIIEHARLFEETKKKAMQFDSLIKVSHSITSESYLDEILNLIVVVTAEMLNSKICSIMLLDEKGEELSMAATQSLSAEYKLKPNIKVANSLTGSVLQTKKPAVVYDVRKDEKYVYRDLAVKEGLTSMVAVPMIVKTKAIGVVNVYTKEPHHFTEEEIGVLQMVSNQAAVAVENTKLMQEALKAREALETRKVIERAKGILMKMNSLSEEAAYRLIHKKSMDTCKSMKEISESIILMAELQK